MVDKKTPEEIQVEEKELQSRVKGFNEKMVLLLGEYKLGLGAVAFVTPDGRIGARPNLFDDSKTKVATPENTPSDSSQADAPKPEEKPEITPAA